MSAAQAGPSARTPLLQAHHATRQSRSSLHPARAASGSTHGLASVGDLYTANTSASQDAGAQASLSAGSSRAPSPHPSSSARPFRRRRRRTPALPLLPTVALLTCAALLVFTAWDVSSIGNCYFPSICKALGKGKGRKDEVYQRNTGAYAPYTAQGAGGGRVNLPRGCEINQVNIVSEVDMLYLVRAGWRSNG